MPSWFSVSAPSWPVLQRHVHTCVCVYYVSMMRTSYVWHGQLRQTYNSLRSDAAMKLTLLETQKGAAIGAKGAAQEQVPRTQRACMPSLFHCLVLLAVQHPLSLPLRVAVTTPGRSARRWRTGCNTSASSTTRACAS